MGELLDVLQDCCPGIDFAGEQHMVDDGILESLDIVMIVTALNDFYDVEITVEDILPENFNSAAKIYEMITKLREY